MRYFLFLMFLPVFGQIPQAERDILIEIYQELDGSNWHFYWDSWVDEDGNFLEPGTEGRWFGVTVEDLGGDLGEHVVGLSLRDEAVGTLPEKVWELAYLKSLSIPFRVTGEIPEDVSLPWLGSLYIGNDAFITNLSASLENLTQLRHLSLNSDEQVSSLSDLSNLELKTLTLTDWAFGSEFPQWFENLATLENLTIHYADLSILSRIHAPSNLKTLNLENNNLKALPPITKLKHLEVLNLTSNDLSSIPNLSTLDALARVRLDHNEIKQLQWGLLPQNITYLDLSYNELSELKGEPQLSKLMYLNLDYCEFQQFPKFNFPELRTLYLRNNKLSEEIPEDLGLSTKLTRLELDGNAIKGTIPAFFSNFTELYYLNLSQNEMTGEIPELLFQLPELSYLRLQSNFFTSIRIGSSAFSPYLNVTRNNLTNEACAQLSYYPGYVSYLSQRHELLNCNNLEPVRFIPWLSDRDGWSSSFYFANTGARYEDVLVKTISKSGDIFGFENRVAPYSEAEFYSSSSWDGGSVTIYAASEHVESTLFFGKSYPYTSGALTNGLRRDELADTLIYPFFPGDMINAVTFWAPLNKKKTEVTLELRSATGFLASHRIFLNQDIPQAHVMQDLFPLVSISEHVMLVAKAADGTLLAGNSFVFNDARDPALANALPVHGASDRLIFPAVYNDASFQSQISLVNMTEVEADVTLKATGQDGQIATAVLAVPAGGLVSKPMDSLFPQLNQMSLQLISTTPIYANMYQLHFGEDVTLPSQTNAVPYDTLTNVLFLGGINQSDSQVVLMAPENEGSLKVRVASMSQYGTFEAADVTLEGSGFKVVELSSILGEFFANTLMVTAEGQQKIVGSVITSLEDGRFSFLSSQSIQQQDLSLNRSFVRRNGEQTTVAVEVKNLGDISFQGMVPVQVKQGAQVLDVIDVSLDLAPKQGQLIEIPLNISGTDELTIFLDTGAFYFEVNKSNNVLNVPLDKSLSFEQHQRFQESYQGELIGLFFNEENNLKIAPTHLIINEKDQMIARLSLLEVGQRVGDDPVVQTSWRDILWLRPDPLTGEVSLPNIYPSDVYRLTFQITKADGSDEEVSVYFSKSRYQEADFWPDPELQKTVPKVFHPFYTKNASRKTKPVLSTGNAVVPLWQSLGVLSSYTVPLLARVELPKGIFMVKARGLWSGDNYRSVPSFFTLEGAGSGKTYIIMAKENLSEQSVDPLLKLVRMSSVEIKGINFMGVDPSQTEIPAVSGRGYATEHGIAYPYQNFPRGLSFSSNTHIQIDDCKFSYFREALHFLNNNYNSEANEWAIELSDIDINSCWQGLALFDQSNLIWRGEGSRIANISTQGILINNSHGIVIDGLEIDGARHRAINADNASNLRFINNRIFNSGQTGIHFGGSVHHAVVAGNFIQTVDRDLAATPFGDHNVVNGIMPYRPLYEGIKVVRGNNQYSSNILISGNEISDVGDGISISQGDATDIIIEGNLIQARRRGLRLEFGWAHTFNPGSSSFMGQLSNVFVTEDNQFSLAMDPTESNQERHGLLSPCPGPADQPDLNTSYLDSYGLDLGHWLAYYPMPIEFLAVDQCPAQTCEAQCGVWRSNAEVSNEQVYLPSLGEKAYIHPNAFWQPISEALDEMGLLRSQIEQFVKKE